jgi:hypothetical protein
LRNHDKCISHSDEGFSPTVKKLRFFSKAELSRTYNFYVVSVNVSAMCS